MTEQMKELINLKGVELDDYPVTPMPSKVLRDCIRWYLNNIWHDASEEPKDATANIIIEGDALINRCFYACCTFETPFLKWECVKHWAYLDDLLPDTLQDVK